MLATLCRGFNRLYRGGFGRKTIAALGRRWLRSGARVRTARVGNGFFMDLALDDYVDSAIYFDAFEYSTTRVLREVLRPGDTFIDVGANVGFFTLMARRLVGATGRVVAFEPNAAIRRRLHANIALNDWSKEVTIYDCGLSDTKGPAELFIPTGTRDAAALASLRKQRDWESHETAVVALERLDDLWPLEERVRLIKIDVEGAELQALRGAEQTIRAQRPHVICEYNRDTARAFGYEPEELLRFLTEDIGGYVVRALASRGIGAGLTDPGVENWWFAP